MINETMSKEKLLALLGYVKAEQESIVLDDFYPTVSISSGTATEPSTSYYWPTPAPVNVMIIVDEDMKAHYEAIIGTTVTWSDVYEWANNILEAGDDPFDTEFDIPFITVEYRQWNSPAGNAYELLPWGQQAFPKPSGVDVTVIMTGQDLYPLGGLAERMGDAFIISTKAANYLMPLANLWQHEASHLYDAPDHDPSINFWEALFAYCIMSYIWAPITRSWHSGCWQTICENRFRFGITYTGFY